MATTKKSGVKVPAEWNAKAMTSAKPKPRAGTIPAKPKVAAKPSAQVNPTKTGVKVPAEWNARMMTSAKPKPRTGTIPAPAKPAAKPTKPAAATTNQTPAKPAAKPAATPTPRSTANYGPPSSQIKYNGAPKAGPKPAGSNFDGTLRRFVKGTTILDKANIVGLGLLGGEILGEAGKAFRQNSPFDSKNDSANRRADPRYQPLRQMSAEEMRNAPKLQQYNPDAPVSTPTTSKPKPAAASKPASQGSSSNPPARRNTNNTSSSSGGGGSSPSRSSSSPAPTIRNPAPQRASQPSQVRQSKNMDENYATWVNSSKANAELAKKVKPGQAGYDAIQKALGKTTSDAKPAAKNGSSSGSDQAVRSIESDPKAKPFNTDKMPTKSDKEKQLQALRIARRNVGIA
jgi:hypothetical protein